MRPRLPWLGIVLVIGACDLKPAPKKQPEPAAAAAAAAPAPVPAAAPAPAGDDADPEKACTAVGVRVAEVVIASATDAVLKAQYEQARADVVRATQEACLRGNWDAELRRCFLAASTPQQLDACNARAPGPAGSRPTRGS